MKIFFPLLPLACFAIIFLNFNLRAGWRRAFLLSAIFWGTLVAAFTEILSLFHLIDFYPIVAAWTTAIIIALAVWLRASPRADRFNWSLPRADFSLVEITLLIATTLIVITIAVIAWYAAPNTWDSSTYHMARVMHWIQNRSVEHYPTNILRQLHMNPWSEFAILHFQILRGDDRFANFIQWFSMVGSLIGVSMIAQLLGVDRRGQVFAVILAASIPMGILQASGTQNDYVVTFWLTCFVYFGLRFKSSALMEDALPTGLALGLAILTKATTYVYAFPFFAWLTIAIFKSQKIKAIQLLAPIALLTLAINIGHYARNYEIYASPLGPDRETDAGQDYVNEILTPASIASNMIRNATLHLGTPYPEINKAMERGVDRFHAYLRLSPDDPRTTWVYQGFQIRFVSFMESEAGNTVHFVFILFSLPLLFLPKYKNRELVAYAITLAFAFILFCAYLKWQPWHSRLHLPLFVLYSVVLGHLLSRISLHADKIIMLAVLFTSYYWVVAGVARPLVGPSSVLKADRTQQYFSYWSSLMPSYLNTASYLSQTNCSDIGLLFGYNDMEYPFWIALKEYHPQPFRVEHVNVSNASAVKNLEAPFNAFVPCAVVTLNKELPNPIFVGNNAYFLQQVFGEAYVYVKQTP